MTLSEHLYLQYMNADTPEKRHECLRRLVGICLKAIGHLTPPWRYQGRWNPNFDALRYKARMPWVFRWLEETLKKPQKDGARYIGRRCRNALIDEIRRHQAEQRRGAKNTPEQTPEQEREYGISRRQEMMAALGTMMRYASKNASLDVVEKGIAFDSILKGSPIKNTDAAKELGRSEGYVRKKKASLWRKLKKAKWERVEHYERSLLAAMKKDYSSWAKKARGDETVWWDRKVGGKPFVFNTKIKPYENAKVYE